MDIRERVLRHAAARSRRDSAHSARDVEVGGTRRVSHILQRPGVLFQMGYSPHDHFQIRRRPCRQVQLHRDAVPGHRRRPVGGWRTAAVPDQLRARHRLDPRRRFLRVVEAHLEARRRLRDFQLQPQRARARRHDRQRRRPASGRQILPNQVVDARRRARQKGKVPPEADPRQDRTAVRGPRDRRSPLVDGRRGQHDPPRPPGTAPAQTARRLARAGGRRRRPDEHRRRRRRDLVLAAGRQRDRHRHAQQQPSENRHAARTRRERSNALPGPPRPARTSSMHDKRCVPNGSPPDGRRLPGTPG